MAKSRTSQKSLLNPTLIDVKFWVKIALAITLLFAFPLQFHFYEAVQPEPALNYYDISYSCVIFDYSDYRDRTMPLTRFSTPLTIVSAIAICIPAVILNRRIRNEKRGESLRDLALFSIFGTALIAIFLVEYFPPAGWDWLIQGYPDRKLNYFGALVIVALVGMPLLIREASYPESNLRLKIVAYGIAFLAIFLPLVALVDMNESGYRYSIAISAFYYMLFESTLTSVPGSEVGQLVISLGLFDSVALLYNFINFGLHFLFGAYTIKYLHGLSSRRRIIPLGVTSFLLPYLFYLFLTNLGRVIVVPLPFLFIFGVIVILFLKPVKQMVDVTEIETEPIQDADTSDDQIPVPLLYFLRSKFSRIRNRFSK